MSEARIPPLLDSMPQPDQPEGQPGGRRSVVRRLRRPPLLAPDSGDAGTPAGPPTPAAQATGPAAGTAPAGVDWDTVERVRVAVVEQLMQWMDRAAETGPRPAFGDQETRAQGTQLINQQLREMSQAQAQSGGGRGWTELEQRRLAQAVDDALWGLGRVQRFLDDDQVENIEITGHDNVVVERHDGLTRIEEPLFADDTALIEWVQWIAARDRQERPFSWTHPLLNLRLPGRARLAASRDVSNRPTVTIRRHRMPEASLAKLVATGMLGQDMAEFLAAAMRARLRIIVAGDQGAGKTTLVRALCREIDPHEHVATIETVQELWLDELPHFSVRPVAVWESRPGAGEPGPDGRRPGEQTVTDLIEHSMKHNLDRLVVGEVVGSEVGPMLHAMQTTPSLSTVHGFTAEEAVQRLVTLAMEYGTNTTHELAERRVHSAVDLVVHVGVKKRQQRWIDEVLALELTGDQGARTQVWRSPRRGQPAQVRHPLPEVLRQRLAEEADYEMPARGVQL